MADGTAGEGAPVRRRGLPVEPKTSADWKVGIAAELDAGGNVANPTRVVDSGHDLKGHKKHLANLETAGFVNAKKRGAAAFANRFGNEGAGADLAEGMGSQDVATGRPSRSRPPAETIAPADPADTAPRASLARPDLANPALDFDVRGLADQVDQARNQQDMRGRAPYEKAVRRAGELVRTRGDALWRDLLDNVVQPVFSRTPQAQTPPPVPQGRGPAGARNPFRTGSL